MPIVWYSFPFKRLYFASINLLEVTNIFSVSFLIALEKCSPSRVNLTGGFLYFSNIFWILSFLIFILWGLFLHHLQSFVGLLCWWNQQLSFLPSFSPNFVSRKLCTFWSVASVFFPLTFAINLFSINFLIKNLFWFVDFFGFFFLFFFFFFFSE